METEYLTPAELAKAWGVDPKTIHRWTHEGKWPEGSVLKTPGGKNRYRASQTLPEAWYAAQQAS